MTIITHEILRSWSPCIDGYNRFCELFPEGADLITAIDGLVADNHDDWGFWLFDKCRQMEFCKDVTDKGNRNTGNMNAGDWNTGSWNTGYRNTGDWNTGDWNTGSMNTGDWNTGDWNTGDMNTGDMNTGNMNTGSWNTANHQAGYFNTITPTHVQIFNKACSREVWQNAKKPNFIFFEINVWVCESDMTAQEKIDNPKFYVIEGYLKSIPALEAWANAWAKATKEDKALLLKLPNFDAAIFKEISGIDVNE